jgi:hypothetical protein
MKLYPKFMNRGATSVSKRIEEMKQKAVYSKYLKKLNVPGMLGIYE